MHINSCRKLQLKSHMKVKVCGLFCQAGAKISYGALTFISLPQLSQRKRDNAEASNVNALSS